MKHSFKKTTIEVELYQKTFNVTRPSGEQFDKFAEKLSTVDPKEARSAWVEFLVPLGFEADALNELELDHFREVCDLMTGVGKKSQTVG